jgi:hypothetical protein
MKITIILIVICFVTASGFAQNTLMVEKVGSSRRYFYHTGDYVKLRVSKKDTLLKGKLWAIYDSAIFVSELRPFEVRLGDIGSVYKKFAFPGKFAKYMAIGSAGIFTIIAINHLINHEQVFTPDMFIIAGSMLGAGLISFSLSEKRCNTGKRWKVKVLDIEVN